VINRHAQRVDVGAHVNPARITGHLLGRGPRQRPDELSGNGDVPLIRIGAAAELRQFRKAEIKDVRLAALVDQNVARFQIAMNHALEMGRVDRFANGREQRHNRAGR